MNNLKVKADVRKNRLYFHFVGVATKTAMEKLYTDVRFCVADLKPEFDVISDFSYCEIIHLDSLPAFKKIMSYLIENGLGEIVRILQIDKLSHKQILNLATRVQGYKPIYVANLEEAEENLKNTVKRRGLRVHLHDFPIKYTINNEEGEGHILDMSTSGCAVKFTTFGPQTGAEMLAEVTFSQKDKPPDIFQFKARIVRVTNNAFGAAFIDLEQDRQELLRQYLLRESRN